MGHISYGLSLDQFTLLCLDCPCCNHASLPVTVPGAPAGIGAGAALCGRAAAHQQEQGRRREGVGWGPSETDNTAVEATVVTKGDFFFFFKFTNFNENMVGFKLCKKQVRSWRITYRLSWSSEHGSLGARLHVIQEPELSWHLINAFDQSSAQMST